MMLKDKIGKIFEQAKVNGVVEEHFDLYGVEVVKFLDDSKYYYFVLHEMNDDMATQYESMKEVGQGLKKVTM